MGLTFMLEVVPRAVATVQRQQPACPVAVVDDLVPTPKARHELGRGERAQEVLLVQPRRRGGVEIAVVLALQQGKFPVVGEGLNAAIGDAHGVEAIARQALDRVSR